MTQRDFTACAPCHSHSFTCSATVWPCWAPRVSLTSGGFLANHHTVCVACRNTPQLVRICNGICFQTPAFTWKILFVANYKLINHITLSPLLHSALGCPGNQRWKGRDWCWRSDGGTPLHCTATEHKGASTCVQDQEYRSRVDSCGLVCLTTWHGWRCATWVPTPCHMLTSWLS